MNSSVEATPTNNNANVLGSGMVPITTMLSIETFGSVDIPIERLVEPIVAGAESKNQRPAPGC